MRSRHFGFLALLLIPLGPALAQRPESTDPRRADSLRHRIEERFTSQVQKELGLTNEQTTKLRATSQVYGARRRELRERERGLQEALSAQLRPGVAANQDSVARLTDAMIELKVAAAQGGRDEMKELSTYLNPVQRARLYVMRERFYHRVKEARDHKKGGHDQKWMGRRQRDQSWM